MKKEDLKKELDFWIKRLINTLERQQTLIVKINSRLERAEKTIDCLERYNQKTVHPNLIYLRDKTENLEKWKQKN